MHWFGWGAETLPIMVLLVVIGIAVFTLIQSLPNFKVGRQESKPIEAAGHGLGEIGLVAIGWLLFEVVFVVLVAFGQPPGFTRDISWLIAALIAYGAAFVCWIPSNGRISILGIRRQWCRSKSSYQGHGFWHVFSAIGALMVYFYFASEISL